MDSAAYLILPLLQGFYWFDEGLQNYLKARGWSDVTRPQSMVMANVTMGVVRPSDIARNLGVSRQAVHTTIGQMVQMGMLELRDDPEDGRSKIVAISETGEAMRRDAREAMTLMTAALRSRIGAAKVKALVEAFSADWGPALSASDLD